VGGGGGGEGGGGGGGGGGHWEFRGRNQKPQDFSHLVKLNLLAIK